MAQYLLSPRRREKDLTGRTIKRWLRSHSFSHIPRIYNNTFRWEQSQGIHYYELIKRIGSRHLLELTLKFQPNNGCVTNETSTGIGYSERRLDQAKRITLHLVGSRDEETIRILRDFLSHATQSCFVPCLSRLGLRQGVDHPNQKKRQNRSVLPFGSLFRPSVMVVSECWTWVFARCFLISLLILAKAQFVARNGAN